MIYKHYKSKTSYHDFIIGVENGISVALYSYIEGVLFKRLESWDRETLRNAPYGLEYIRTLSNEEMFLKFL